MHSLLICSFCNRPNSFLKLILLSDTKSLVYLKILGDSALNSKDSRVIDLFYFAFKNSNNQLQKVFTCLKLRITVLMRFLFFNVP